jgi:hypothetical protein
MDTLQHEGAANVPRTARIAALREAAFPIVVGVLAFLIVAGHRILDPRNIGWLSTGDPRTHYLGWAFFRSSEWSWPIGLNPRYGLELGSSILYSDSNPLFAYCFKLLDPLLGEPFQYFGLWLFLCFVLQAWFGWKLAGLVSDDRRVRTLAAGLFVFSPPMLLRATGHFSLTGHFLLLAGLYLLLAPGVPKRSVKWGLLLATASCVHAYFVGMLGVLWLAGLLQRAANRQIGVRRASVELLLVPAGLAVACWQNGYFAVGGSVGMGGFGLYRTNVLALFDANGWSQVLPDIPGPLPDGGGLAYPGLGVLVLLAAGLVARGRRRGAVVRLLRRHWIVGLALMSMALFAFSHNIGIGPYDLVVPVPQWVLEYAGVFRASGRFFWPVFYALVLGAIGIAARRLPPSRAILVFAAALAVQIADTSAGWLRLRAMLMQPRTAAWSSPMRDPFWSDAATRYRTLRRIMPGNLTPRWEDVATFAATHGMATDAVYLARVNGDALREARAKANMALRTGQYDPGTLYIVDDGQLRLAVVNLEPADLLARVDGFGVLAPGWKRCAACPQVDEIVFNDLVYVPAIGETVPFAAGPRGNGRSYLLEGWSAPERWGIWSDAGSARLLLPAVEGSRSLTIEATAAVTAEHPRQVVRVELDGEPVREFVLTARRGNTLTLPLPGARAGAPRRGYHRIRFTFPDAVSPASLGSSRDRRRLALGLQSITFH